MRTSAGRVIGLLILAINRDRFARCQLDCALRGGVSCHILKTSTSIQEAKGFECRAAKNELLRYSQRTSTMRPIIALLLSWAVYLGIGATGSSAEPMLLDAVLSTKADISLAFKDDSRHFVTLLRREGSATGNGVFNDAKVVEYGLHDVTLGENAKASGYIEAVTTGGDIAYFRWRLRAQFVAGPDGKAKPINSGYWELSGGTGHFAKMRGVGTMLIEFLNKTERRYLLEGDISPSP